MTVTYTVGDTREAIKGIADGSVDLIASSPPFLALRSYVPADHHAKGDEIGSERNPAEFIDMLLGLTAEWGRADLHGRDAIGIDFDARNKAIYPARYDEVKRALYGTPAPMPGQGDLFAEVAL